MSTYQHILVASNFTAESELILDKAQELAHIHQAKLSIVHIVELSPVYFGGSEFALPLDPKIEADLIQQAKDTLIKQAVRLNIPESQQYLELGFTADKLIELVNTINVDLLMVGHHQQHGLALLLGSTANSLLHEMPCDVLAVNVDTQVSSKY